MTKRVLIFCLVLFGLNGVTGQDLLKTTTFIKMPMISVGVYKTYSEFINNSPSIQQHYEIVTRSSDLSKSVKKDYVRIYNPNTRKYQNLYQGDIWGFSDGKNTYKLYDNMFYKIHDIVAITRISCQMNTSAYTNNPRYHNGNRYDSYSSKVSTSKIIKYYDLKNDIVYHMKEIEKLHTFILANISNNDSTIRADDVRTSLQSDIEYYNSLNPVLLPNNKNPNESHDMLIF